MLKKIVVGLAIFLGSAFAMELIVKKLTSKDPPLLELAVDSIYRFPSTRIKLGTLKASTLKVDSISSNGDQYFFTVGILGHLRDTVLTGKIVGVGGKSWKIVELNGVPE